MPDSDEEADKWLDLNTKQSNLWPNITRKGKPPSDAEDFEGVEDKFNKYYSDKPGKSDG